MQEGEVNLGVTQTKRIQVIDNTVALGTQLNVTLNTADDPCNIHGLILDLWAGVVTSTVPTFGQWALSLLPRGGTTAPALTTAGLNAETNNPIIWMLGSWLASGDDKAHIGGAPRTSRNCPRGGRLIVGIENSALSGTGIRIHGVATWFETIK